MMACEDYCRPEHIGHEVRGVYDGTLYWSCPRTNKAWPRFLGTSRLAAQSEFYCNKFLEGGGHNVRS